MADLTGYDDAMPLKSALEDLFGADEWYRLKDSRDIETWKKSLLKALKASSLAISSTVEIADDDWRNDANLIIEQGEKNISASKSIRDVFSAFSACYLTLSFHQLGFCPRRKGTPGRVSIIRANWQLSSYRSVQYIQTNRQRLMLECAKDSRPVADKALDPKYEKLRRS